MTTTLEYLSVEQCRLTEQKLFELAHIDQIVQNRRPLEMDCRPFHCFDVSMCAIREFSHEDYDVTPLLSSGMFLVFRFTTDLVHDLTSHCRYDFSPRGDGKAR